MEKQCSRCKKVKNETEYHKDSCHSTGLKSACIECRSKLEKEYNSKPKAKQRSYEYQVEWNKKNIEKKRGYGRNWYRANKEKAKNYTLVSAFGITLEEYNDILKSQGGVCAICGGSQINGKSLSVDHNHITGKVRGLLCNYCNWILGHSFDNPNILRKCIEYLGLDI